MKVFLTGGTGYVGAHVTRELVAKGHALTLLVRDATRLPAFARDPRITIVEGDVRHHHALDTALSGHDALLHNALVWGDESGERELEDARASLGLFSAAQRAGVGRLVYTSSTAVHRPFRSFMKADDALRPTDLYGVTKATGELALFAVAQAHDLNATVIRASPVVGAPATADAAFKSDRRFDELLSSARRGERLVVARGDGRQLIGAADLALVFAAALEVDGRETFLAVAKDVVTWEQIARAIVREVGSGEVVVEDAETAPCRFDTEKLERALGLAFTAERAVLEHVAHLARSAPHD